MLIRWKVVPASTGEQSPSEYDVHLHFSWLFIVQGSKNRIYGSYCTVDLADICEIED